MVFQPYLPTTPTYPSASEKIQTGDDDGNCTDDADCMPRFSKTTCLPDAEKGYYNSTENAVSNLNEDFHVVSLASKAGTDK